MLFLLAALAGAAFLIFKAFKTPPKAAPEPAGLTGLQKVVSDVGAVVGTAGAAVSVGAKVAGLLGIGKAATGSALAATATTQAATTGVAASTGGGSSAIGGAASGLGTAAATAGLLAAPFVLGPLLAKLIGGKSFEEWEAQLKREAAEQAALDSWLHLKNTEAANAAAARAERELIHGLASVNSGNVEGTLL